MHYRGGIYYHPKSGEIRNANWYNLNGNPICWSLAFGVTGNELSNAYAEWLNKQQGRGLIKSFNENEHNNNSTNSHLPTDRRTLNLSRRLF